MISSRSTFGLEREEAGENVFKEVREVREGFVEIQAGFGGTMTFECESSCDNASGYILTGPFGWFHGASDIHLCPHWFNHKNWLEGTATIIHEMAHKYAGKDDEAYEWEPKYSRLSVSDAIDNADSYAAFARDI